MQSSFIELHEADGTPILVGVAWIETVTPMTPSSPRRYSGSVKCEVALSDGNRGVTEDYDTIKRLIAWPDNAPLRYSGPAQQS